MKTTILIKWLNNIDERLKNSTYKKQETFVGKLSGETMQLPPTTEQRYNTDELLDLFEKKGEIINELNKRGLIDEKQYVAYLLSENCEFTPKLNYDYFPSI